LGDVEAVVLSGCRLDAEKKLVNIARKRDTFDTEHLKSDLGTRSVRSGAATVGGQGARFVLRLVSVPILARLLAPGDFGLIAMVTVMTNFIMVFRDMGLSSATVQQSEINHAQVSTLFWLNVVIGGVLMVLTSLVAPAVAWFYGDQRLTAITMCLSVAFLFAGLTVQHQALLRRQMRFSALAVIDVAAVFVGTVAAIVTAVWGARYWSLVVQEVTMAASAAVGAWLASGWRPAWPSRRSGVRRMILFGGNVSGFNFVNYFARNLDHLLLGKFWGPDVLGLYSRAYGLLMLPISQLTSPMGAVAMPALSRLQDDSQRYARYYARFVLLLSFVSMPLVVLLGVCSENAVRLFLGDQWMGASRIFQILALTAFIQPVLSTAGIVVLSLGQTARLFRLGLFCGSAAILSFLAGIRWGASGVAWGYCIANYMTMLPMLWYSFRMSPVSVTCFFRTISRPVAASLIMAASVLGLRLLLTGHSDAVILTMCLLGGLMVYMSTWTLLPGGWQTLCDIRDYATRILPVKSIPFDQTSPERRS